MNIIICFILSETSYYDCHYLYYYYYYYQQQQQQFNSVSQPDLSASPASTGDACREQMFYPFLRRTAGVTIYIYIYMYVYVYVYVYILYILYIYIYMHILVQYTMLCYVCQHIYIYIYIYIYISVQYISAAESPPAAQSRPRRNTLALPADIVLHWWTATTTNDNSNDINNAINDNKVIFTMGTSWILGFSQDSQDRHWDFVSQVNCW